MRTWKEPTHCRIMSVACQTTEIMIANYRLASVMLITKTICYVRKIIIACLAIKTLWLKSLPILDDENDEVVLRC